MTSSIDDTYLAAEKDGHLEDLPTNHSPKFLPPLRPTLRTGTEALIEETEPWHEDGQTWRTLLVTYPGTIVAHHRQQTYYFDDTGLLRRLDYSVDILGGGPAVHYPSAYREFDGIIVPTRRRVYVRNPDGTPVRDSVSIAIDIADVTFC
jgi:hypothetical protein